VTFGDNEDDIEEHSSDKETEGLCTSGVSGVAFTITTTNRPNQTGSVVVIII